ncbi:hypothetical protein JQ633_24250 [Bradyrhizobium tropiciagri]|uniref:terpene synthase family protein n=1 Tax=Bradyrhizobium tropiciagri TaxID=312253 RepID=UPI001BA55ACB|nr:hypothetical protein [Bradyrhizobium tropiciagri]MBR0873491.1 hypothetical protein [Bradyrhizobium tropiciagri]
MKPVLLPELVLPFRTAMHPRSAEIQASTERWCREFDLLRSPSVAAKFHALGYGRVMSTLLPHAPFAGLALVADWNSFFFITDDQQNNAVRTDRTRAYEDLIEGMRAAISGQSGAPRAGRHPLLGALDDLLDRSVPRRPAYWVARFRRNLNAWLTGHLSENAYRVSGSIPTIESYISVRRDASTVFPTLDLVESIEGAHISDALYASDDFQTLLLGTADIMCWVNDIHSLHMEQDDPINFVTVLAHHHGLDTQQAIDAVTARIALRVNEYLAAAAALPDRMDALGIYDDAQLSIMRYVADQQSWAAGMEKWDRTDTIRFAISEAPEPKKSPTYTDDLFG